MLRLGDFFFKARDLIFPLVFLTLALTTKPRILMGQKSLDHLMDTLGIAVALTGQFLRAAVIGFAYIKRGGKNKKIFAENLVQEGFFAHVRNPLYLGNILILFGLILIHNSLAFYLLGIPFFLLAYISIIFAEENFLGMKFGKDYKAYCKRVNRLLPSFTGLGKTLLGMKFDWKRLIRKEYGSTFSWVTCALALLAWQAYKNFGYSSQKTEILILFSAWIPVVLAYLTARIFKKNNLLGAD